MGVPVPLVPSVNYACGLNTGQKETEVMDQVLNALEKSCCRQLLQKRRQSENENLQKKIKFIESRFELS